MVHFNQVCHFMGGDIVQHRWRRENQPPGKIEMPPRTAGPPARAGVPQRNFAGLRAQPGGMHIDGGRYRGLGFKAEKPENPVLKGDVRARGQDDWRFAIQHSGPAPSGRTLQEMRLAPKWNGGSRLGENHLRPSGGLRFDPAHPCGDEPLCRRKVLFPWRRDHSFARFRVQTKNKPLRSSIRPEANGNGSSGSRQDSESLVAHVIHGTTPGVGTKSKVVPDV